MLRQSIENISDGKWSSKLIRFDSAGIDAQWPRILVYADVVRGPE